MNLTIISFIFIIIAGSIVARMFVSIFSSLNERKEMLDILDEIGEYIERNESIKAEMLKVSTELDDRAKEIAIDIIKQLQSEKKQPCRTNHSREVMVYD
jgi:RNA-binding protein YhbY